MRVIFLSVHSLLALLIFASVAQAQTFGIQYGPRAFWAAPVGTSAYTVKYENLQAGTNINGVIIDGFDIETNTIIPSYTHYFDFFGQTASILAAVPYLFLDGNLRTNVAPQPISLFSEQGVPDPYVQFYTTLIGGETLPLQQFVRTEPGFILGIFGAARPPLGKYNSANLANPGANRWEWRLGLPMQYIWGLPTQQTSIEFVPTVYFFGDNDEPFGGGVLSQDPFFQFEGHITRDFGPIFWGSVNALYGVGGETSLSGISNNDGIEYVSAGATVGARLTRSLSLSASYGRRVWSKIEGNEGQWVSIGLTITQTPMPSAATPR